LRGEKKAINIMVDYLESRHEYDIALQWRDWESAETWLVQTQVDLQAMKDYVKKYYKENKKSVERTLIDDDEY
jgi:hypothetical protein